MPVERVTVEENTNWVFYTHGRSRPTLKDLQWAVRAHEIELDLPRSIQMARRHVSELQRQIQELHAIRGDHITFSDSGLYMPS